MKSDRSKTNKPDYLDSEDGLPQTTSFQSEMRQHVINLQMTVSHLELTVERLDSVITRQDRDIQTLQRQLQLIYKQIEGQSDEGGVAPFDINADKPPHY